MLNLKQIEAYYPASLQSFKKNMLREYLQYKILDIMFQSPFANKLSFLGGTALRIVYDNTRFSEDLDFDNFDLSQSDFADLTQDVRKNLEKQGYQVEIRNVLKGAYRCYVKLPKILFENELSSQKEEKILIQIDTAAHHFPYVPENKILNKFEVFTQIKVTPLDILLSQKIYAALNRKRPKGRDFFDILFLLGKVKPNYDYLHLKLGIRSSAALKERFLQYLKNVNLREASVDVKPFLFHPEDSKNILLFGEYIQQVGL